jgi:recombination protein RecT
MAGEIAVVKDQANLKRIIEGRKMDLAALIPKHVGVDSFVKSVLMAAHNQPKILDCSVESVYACAIKAASLGLDISGGALGHAYMVPFFNSKKGVQEAQFIPGYKGLIELVRRNGKIAKIEATAVFANDVFEVMLGTNPGIKHQPNVVNRGELIAVYAVATLRSGEFQFDVMNKEEVDAIRKRSKASNGGPWVTDYVEMARKTVVRRLVKYLPLSVDDIAQLDSALEHENKIEVEYEDVTQAAPVIPVGKQKIGSKKQKAAEQDVVDVEATKEPAETPTEGPTEANAVVSVASEGEVSFERAAKAVRAYAVTRAKEGEFDGSVEEAEKAILTFGKIKNGTIAWFKEMGKEAQLVERALELAKGGDPRFEL